MSPVKKVVVAMFIVLVGWAGVAECRQRESVNYPDEMSGVLVLAAEDHEPADVDQGMYYGQPDENADIQEPADSENTFESGQEEDFRGSGMGMQDDPDPSMHDEEEDRPGEGSYQIQN